MSISINKQPQDVFKDADAMWLSYAYDGDGSCYLHDYPVDDMICTEYGWQNKDDKGHWLYVGYVKDPSDWRNSAINRTDVEKNGTQQVIYSGRRNGKSTIFKGIDKRHLYVHPAKPENEKTVVTLFDQKAQHQIEQQNKEILALKSLVNVQDEQLKEFEAKEAEYDSILNEVLQTLYAVDPEARVSLTSGQLLQLVGQDNEVDLPFF